MAISEVISDRGEQSAAPGTVLVIAGAFGFSAKAVLVKLAYSYSTQLDAITLMALRMLMALPFFIATLVWIEWDRASRRVTGEDKLALFGLGMLGYYIASYLDFSGLAYISAGLERLILFLYPTLVILLSAILWRRRIRPPEIMALMISYAGILLVFFESVGTDSANMLKGAGLVFASAIAFALFLIGNGKMVRRLGSMRFTAWSMVIACLATIIHFGATREITSLIVPVEIYWIALLMALFSTVIPAFLLNEGIRRIGSGQAAIISSFGPVSTLGLAYVFLDETLSLLQAIGVVLVLTGVWFAGRSKKSGRQCSE